MTEYVCFICGLLTGIGLWFFHDLKDNPYLRGVDDGYRLAVSDLQYKRGKKNDTDRVDNQPRR